jgi:eukaryotic-like serine/threonine-protein kinase
MASPVKPKPSGADPGLSSRSVSGSGSRAEVEGPAKYVAGDVIVEKYELLRLLGEGGMGAVWLAKNLTLEVEVALKLIRREVATLEASERLLQEARAAAKLGHPSIVRVFDFGVTELDDPFIVMELLRGESLATLIDRRGRLPSTEAIQVLLPVASALCAAHAKGIVHRDLKPDNIILTIDDSGTTVPKVVDFGIAKLRKEDTVRRNVTQAGAVLGSPDYMSPEQARGRGDVDERTDVWSMCVLLYECLVGRRPFDGPNYNSLIASILEEAPVPTTDFAAGDADLWSIVERGLEKKVTERWPNMRSLGQALAEWAMLQGVNTDVAGVAIAPQWLDRAGRSPLSSHDSFASRERLPSRDSIPTTNQRVNSSGTDLRDGPAPGAFPRPPSGAAGRDGPLSDQPVTLRDALTTSAVTSDTPFRTSQKRTWIVASVLACALALVVAAVFLAGGKTQVPSSASSQARSAASPEVATVPATASAAPSAEPAPSAEASVEAEKPTAPASAKASPGTRGAAPRWTPGKPEPKQTPKAPRGSGLPLPDQPNF